MSKDKKPKKAKAPVVHGAHNRGREEPSRLLEPEKTSTIGVGKKKK